jgi:hypothetical protein
MTQQLLTIKDLSEFAMPLRSRPVSVIQQACGPRVSRSLSFKR